MNGEILAVIGQGFGVGGQHDDGLGGRTFFEGASDGQTIHFGETKIDDDHVEFAGNEHGQGYSPLVAISTLCPSIPKTMRVVSATSGSSSTSRICFD